MKKLAMAAMIVAALFTCSCSVNDDAPKAPTNAITLNMMNDGNGATTIGQSDVIINRSNNFQSTRCLIADLGKRGGYDKKPNLEQVAQEVAVVPGSYYQIILGRDVEEVAGKYALASNSSYYNVRVDSWLYSADKQISGAKVAYALCEPAEKNLPEWGETIDVHLSPVGGEYAEEASYSFSKDAVIDPDISIRSYNGTSLYYYLEAEVDGNKIKFRNESYTGSGQAEVVLNVRVGSVYSEVSFIVYATL